jgi:2,4-dienoyl-CoA reductase-like NADH-dependent reductase (Old Yellow Enzyme family)
MQLNHTGRQSPRIFGGRSFFSQPIGASTIPMKVRAKNQKLFGRPLFALFFNAPRAATELEIQDVIDGFVRGAELALRSGVRSSFNPLSYGNCSCLAPLMAV